VLTRQAGELLLTQTAASAGTTSERAQALLEDLHRVVPFDGAWLALADPLGHGYTPWRASTWTSRSWSSSPAR